MNIDELKETWDQLNQKGLEGQTENEIRRIIGFGTSEVVSSINKKLFVDMAIAAIAAVVSAFGIILFYLAYDPLNHTWIDLSKIIPIQILGLVIFSVLFLFGWLKYKLVNRRFTSESVMTYISSLLINFRNYSSVFILVILILLAVTYYVELNYFIEENLILKLGGSALLTTVSYVVIRYYYKKSFGSYLEDLISYQKQLK